MQEILKIEGLTVTYRRMARPAVDGVDLTLAPGEVLGVVGESGCGKSTLAKALMGILPGCGSVTAGSAFFEQQDLLQLSAKERRKLQGTGMGIIIQDSISSLNPIRRVRDQAAELLRQKRGMDRPEAEERMAELLSRVHCPADTMNKYPFQLSGGQRQRVVIALSFALCPKLLLADEPTTALDVTVQAQVLAELEALRREYGTAVLLISHNLGVVSQIADKVAVMYRGQVVEYGSCEAVLSHPGHPYTKGLLASLPTLALDKNTRLEGIPEQTAAPAPEGCCFYHRCPRRCEDCRKARPPLIPNEQGVLVSCLKSN